MSIENTIASAVQNLSRPLIPQILGEIIEEIINEYEEWEISSTMIATKYRERYDSDVVENININK